MSDPGSTFEAGDGPTQHIRRVADSTIIVLLARLMALVGVPTAGVVAVWVLSSVNGLHGSVIEMKTALVVGIEPRVTRLESDLAGLRSGVDAKLAGRFDQTDGKLLEERLRREIDQILAALSEIRGRMQQRTKE